MWLPTVIRRGHFHFSDRGRAPRTAPDARLRRKLTDTAMLSA
jgi:hypothetical protein